MMLDFACEGCGQKYRVDVGLSGRQIKCKKCGEAVTVPSPNAVSPTARATATPPAKPPIQSFGDPPRASRPPQRMAPAEDEFDYDMTDVDGGEEVVDDPYRVRDEYEAPKAFHRDDDFGGPQRAGIGGKKSRRTEPAGLWKRFVGNFVDSLVFVAIVVVAFGLMIAVLAVMGEVEEDSDAPLFLLCVFYFFALVAYCGYSAGMTSSTKQATLGKLAMGIFVTDLDGRRISFGRATGRELAKLLITPLIPFGIGFLMALGDRKQALHDRIAGTLVRRSP